MTEPHCETCYCGRRAPVQSDYGGSVSGRPRRGHGTISWAEHLECYAGYSARFGSAQSAERLAERGGFAYDELLLFLGREPKTWRPA